ncbi:hypothetical protein IGS67_08670 [Flavimobilis sp. GY10621]|uniref:Uncharacterized protein n=1 Tax=Flavimobilis rhizosphaerae TaxID=2775421 RepID=A0ABR9DQZ4_9MICO|nr:hypothetical protein [Flavimobilis rhizosphaerae]MBD9699560.1 hypothetical protein [Flavimobilis rhizosphaerae]
MNSKKSDSIKLFGLAWQQHVGLIIGALTSIAICLKLLAVAGWDVTTAFGILAASGTVDVLTGTLLGILPVLYGVVAIKVVPVVERNLSRRSPVERAAARVMESWPALLLVLIVPTMLIIALALLVIVEVVVRRLSIRRAEKSRRGAGCAPAASAVGASKFETASVAVGGLIFLVFTSLPTPWVPPETIRFSGVERTAFVFAKEGDSATVLMADGRVLRRVEAASLTGELCSTFSGWWEKPILGVLGGDRYARCP